MVEGTHAQASTNGHTKRSLGLSPGVLKRVSWQRDEGEATKLVARAVSDAVRIPLEARARDLRSAYFRTL